ncbi:MAG: hypothetical protein JWO46_2633, partial [Nocardioidaceae bacterium]|nr:hypothetical protein [Nocardioidaceae bacterium]
APLHQLDRQLLADSLERLHQRISARLPDQNLTALAASIKTSVPDAHARYEATAHRLQRISGWTRAISVVFVLAVAVALVLALADFSRSSHDGADWLSLVNTVVGDLVYAAVAVAFLRAVPERLTRSSLTHVLHELRSTAHVIDMHQLGKDPERLRDDYEATGASIHPHLPHKESAAARRADLHHYLTYCIELLGLVSKSAALCAESSGDPVVLSMVNDVESLTSDMSQKIFQKLALLPKDA